MSPPMGKNDDDLRLLREDPGSLILHYEPMVRTIVRYHTSVGLIHLDDRNEVVQYVMEELLNRAGKIRAQYNGQALLRTYCAALVRNLCKDWVRNKRKGQTVRLVRDVEMEPYGGVNPLHQTLIDDEIRYFEKVLILFGQGVSKLILFLKVYCRIPISRSDLQAYNPGMTEQEIDQFINQLDPGRTLRDQDVYDLLNILIGKKDQKIYGNDAIRKWIRARLMDMARLMNSGRQTHYDPETIQILIEHYFMQSGQAIEKPEVAHPLQKKEQYG